MGNTIPEQNSLAFLLDSYTLLGQQENLKILIDKNTEQQFALMEQCFPQRSDYQRVFKKLTNRNPQQCENVLQMVKMWSKQHNGICSNVYKIYRVYEYPRVKLIDQILARQKQQKLFEEVELFSILQSCLNAIADQEQLVNLSPQFVFILPEGSLKVSHPDLLDPNHRTNYHQDYYYSPEKIANFQSQYQSPSEIAQQKVFSIAMTILHSALLTSPSSCYQISSRKFNRKKLSIYLQTLTDLYGASFCSLIMDMLKIDPIQRCSIEDVQQVVNDYFINNSNCLANSKLSNQSHLQNMNHQRQYSKVHELSLLYSRETQQRPSEQLEIQSHVKRPTLSVQFNLENSKGCEVPRNHHILERTKKTKEKITQDKENIYTDPKIIELIRSGISQITKTHDYSCQQLQPKDINTIFQPIVHSIKDPFSQYELKTQQKDKCTFIVQTYEDNSHFEGMVQFGLKNGYGKLVYPDGVYYEGNFKNDTLQGKGSLFYGKGRPAYVGQWIDNKFHGIGTLYNEFPTPLFRSFDYRDFNALCDCWIKYEGEFVEDVKEGWGKIVLTSGQTMEGSFSKGLLHGGCVFTTADGQKIEGIWNNNVMLQN